MLMGQASWGRTAKRRAPSETCDGSGTSHVRLRVGFLQSDSPCKLCTIAYTPPPGRDPRRRAFAPSPYPLRSGVTSMAPWVRQFVLLLLAGAGLSSVSGCFGVSQNPSYFPHLLPTGDIIRTHAKPPGFGYFSNFDPHAVHLEVRPIESTNPVRTQHVLIATVYDEKGQPRRDRRVEWMLEGVGNIVEVDESGLFAGRGYKVDNKYAVSYTDYCEHTLH